MPSTSVHHHRTDRLAGLHQREALVDVFQFQRVGDQVVDVDLAFHVPVDDLRHVGAAPGAAERGALPYATGDELERPRPDLLARAGDADDDGDAPAAVAALERLPHHVHAADALEAVVGTAARQLDEAGDEIALHVLRIHEMRQAELAAERLARGIQVDADDHLGAY